MLEFDVEGPTEWFPDRFFKTLRSVFPKLYFRQVAASTEEWVRWRFMPSTAREAYLIGKYHAEVLNEVRRDDEASPPTPSPKRRGA